ncbi:MAG: two-component sensor histidine kinase [Cryomorphaceae bacterium]|jgi:two-component sensor histidine kinase
MATTSSFSGALRMMPQHFQVFLSLLFIKDQALVSLMILKKKDSFGSGLIEALTEQLNKTLKIRDDLMGVFYQLDFEDYGK